MSTTRTRLIPRQATSPDMADAAHGPAQRTGVLDRWMPRPLDRSILQLWLWTRLSVFLLVGAGVWILNANPALQRPVGYLSRWDQWDTQHYLTIAQWGYGGDPAHPPWVPLEAFFPGYPMLLRLGHAVTGLDYVVVGLIVSLLSGAIASVALARIALDYAAPGQGERHAERTVLLFLIAPTTVFLSACYTETLFLALALPAWLAARKGHWWAAGLLAAGAGAVRFQGAFLGAALIVAYFTDPARPRQRRTATALLLPFVPFVSYMAWLFHRTGDWRYWQHAEERGWGQHTVWPWQGLLHALDGRFNGQARTDFAWMYLVDVATVLVGIALTVWLIRHRRWGETTYVGLGVLTMATSSLWQSFPRYALAWWPLWAVLAGWSLRRPAVFRALLVVFAPLAVTFTLMFSTGRWAG